MTDALGSSRSAVSAPTLAITVASGALGRLTAEELARGGTPLRLLVRHPERAPLLPRAVVMACSYCDSAQARAALEGVTTLFMISASEEHGWLEHQLGFVAAARDAGVEHIVYTSRQGAAADALAVSARSHFATEQAVRASGMAWTILRNSLYLDVIPLLPDADGAIHGPVGGGRVAAVAKLDIARAAAAVLRDPAAHAGRTYELTGPEALEPHGASAILTAATGRGVRYVEQPRDALAGDDDGPHWRLEGWMTSHAAVARGDYATVSDHVELLTGRPPISLLELVSS